MVDLVSAFSKRTFRCTKGQLNQLKCSHYTLFFRWTRVDNSLVNDEIWPNLYLIQDFMIVFVICKNANSIKCSQHSQHYKSGDFSRHTRAANSEIYGLTWLKIVQVFLAVLVICSNEKDLIKREVASFYTVYNMSSHGALGREGIWPQVHKTFFMLSSAETKIYPAHKC